MRLFLTITLLISCIITNAQWTQIGEDIDGEAREEVFAADNIKNVVSGTISIPSSATGQTRMRISMKRGSYSGPCEVFSYGEVEDYTANFDGFKHGGISQTFNKDLVIFPNPNNGRFKVTIDKDIHPEAWLKVYDMKGQQLYDMPLSQSNFELDLS